MFSTKWHKSQSFQRRAKRFMFNFSVLNRKHISIPHAQLLADFLGQLHSLHFSTSPRQWLPYAALTRVQTECAWTYKTRYLDKGLRGWLLVLRAAGLGVMHRCGREWRRCLNAPWPQTVWRLFLLSKLCWLVNRMLCRVSLSLCIKPLCTVRWLLPVFVPHLSFPQFLPGPHFK